MTSPESRPPADAVDQYNYLSHRQILVVLGGLMAGMFLAALDMSIVGTALPRIVSDLGGLEHLSWVVTAYLLTSTASTPLWGKISDLYGRRPLFQAAIVVFLIGSLVAGAAGSMSVLIAGRAVQGLGAGGLMALALATIGDIISPRERGRYQGYFAAVFGTSSVAGPLLGGWFTDGPGWQWIFWINIPIGVAALVVTSVALKAPTVRREHSIDYLGAAIVVASVTSFLLYTSWAGTQYGWTDPVSLALLTLGIVLAGVFVLVESRATEPILPLRLFRNRVYTPTILFTAIMGLAMFGGIIYLPVYLQVVQGFSPTESGLALLPMVVGIFATSVPAGQIMSRTGRYKVFPIVGAAVTGTAMLLMSTLGAETSFWLIAIYFFIFGAGLGFTMQIVVTAVQNAVDQRDMGAATSSVAFFRSMGAAFGTALFGAVLTSQLGHYLAAAAGGRLPPGTDESKIANNVQAIQALPGDVKAVVIDAWVRALHDMFLTAVPILVVGFVTAFFIPELPLRQAGEPTDAESILAAE